MLPTNSNVMHALLFALPFHHCAETRGTTQVIAMESRNSRYWPIEARTVSTGRIAMRAQFSMDWVGGSHD